MEDQTTHQQMLVLCLDECTHDWLGNPVNEWAFVPWRDPQGSLATPLAAERVEGSGDTAKKFWLYGSFLGVPIRMHETCVL